MVNVCYFVEVAVARGRLAKVEPKNKSPAGFPAGRVHKSFDSFIVATALTPESYSPQNNGVAHAKQARTGSAHFRF